MNTIKIASVHGMWALFSFWKGDVIYGKQIAGVPKNVGRGAAAADRKQGVDHSQKSRQKNKESRKNQFSLIGRQTVIMRMGPDGIIKTMDILKKR